ncbi:MAG: hypothetical protein LBR07_06585 [Puniceicoccales bacterium]|jgi:DNA repair exonuclease SbcCD ATPase subunit|nr:hypothetical protein [Puniceicoccales bacterium]
MKNKPAFFLGLTAVIFASLCFLSMSELSEADARVANANKKTEQLVGAERARVKSAERAADAARAERDDVLRRNETLRRELAESRAGHAALVKAREDAENTLREQVAAARAASEPLRAENKKLQERVAALTEEGRKNAAKVSDQLREIEDLREELEALNKELAREPNATRLRERDRQISDLLAENNRLRAAAAAGSTGTGSGAGSVGDAAASRAALEAKDATIQALKADVQVLVKRNAELESELEGNRR